MDIHFNKKNGLYIAEIADIVDISATTLSKSQLKSIETAREFARNAGFVSELEAIGLVKDGNIVGLSVTADDIKLAYQIYGPAPEVVKGRTVYKHPGMELWLERACPVSKNQILLVDVIHVLGKKIF